MLMRDPRAECLAMAEQLVTFESLDMNSAAALLRRVADALPQEPEGDVVEAVAAAIVLRNLGPAAFAMMSDGEKEDARACATRALSAAEPFVQVRIAAAAEDDGWQPIETAPTNQDVLCAKWLSDNCCFLVVAQKVPACANRWVSDSGLMTLVPTHWRPLPAPPARQENHQDD